jgi:hypothetical protein
MISFGGARKTVDVGAIERIKGWAAASLAGSSAFDADATLMVAELECKVKFNHHTEPRVHLLCVPPPRARRLPCPHLRGLCRCSRPVQEPGCPPVETVVSVLDKANPQKVKIIKAMAEVSEDDVRYAIEQLKAEAESPPFTITVKTPVGTKVEVETQALDEICALKDKVMAATGLPKERLRLMYLGRELLDHSTTVQSGLKAGSVVEHGVGSSYFWQGEGTLAISMTLHEKNRARLFAEFKSGSEAPKLNMCGHCPCAPNSHIVLMGGKSAERHSSDHEPLFRQESFFHWATGVTEPDCYLVMDVDAKQTTLFVPRLPEE